MLLAGCSNLGHKHTWLSPASFCAFNEQGQKKLNTLQCSLEKWQEQHEHIIRRMHRVCMWRDSIQSWSLTHYKLRVHCLVLAQENRLRNAYRLFSSCVLNTGTIITCRVAVQSCTSVPTPVHRSSEWAILKVRVEVKCNTSEMKS